MAFGNEGSANTDGLLTKLLSKIMKGFGKENANLDFLSLSF